MSGLTNDTTAYACPRCHRVTPALYEVVYCRGLSIYDPSWMCGVCLSELEREDRNDKPSTDGRMSYLAWDVRVLDQKGSAAALRPAA